MARPPRGRPEHTDATPQSMPKTTPQEYSSAGHDFTLQAVMEMQRTLGGVAERIDGLSGGLEKMADKLGDIEKAVHAVKIGAIVAGAILTVVGGVLWWAIGDRVTAAVHTALGAPAVVQASPPTDAPALSQPRKGK
jgi:hypothetical protein